MYTFFNLHISIPLRFNYNQQTTNKRVFRLNFNSTKVQL